MDISERNRVSYQITEDPQTSILTVDFTDTDTSESIGTLVISKNRTQSFTNALQEIFREVFDAFQPHYKHTSTLTNRSSGTISFREE